MKPQLIPLFGGNSASRSILISLLFFSLYSLFSCGGGGGGGQNGGNGGNGGGGQSSAPALAISPQPKEISAAVSKARPITSRPLTTAPQPPAGL